MERHIDNGIAYSSIFFFLPENGYLKNSRWGGGGGLHFRTLIIASYTLFSLNFHDFDTLFAFRAHP